MDYTFEAVHIYILMELLKEDEIIVITTLKDLHLVG